MTFRAIRMFLKCILTKSSHLNFEACLSSMSWTVGHGCCWSRALWLLWCLSRADLSATEAGLLRHSPPARLILHATGIISIDHGCRSVCRWLHRSVSLIIHSYSSSGDPCSCPGLSCSLPSCPSHCHPLSSPLTCTFSCLRSHLLSRTHFFLN